MDYGFWADPSTIIWYTNHRFSINFKEVMSVPQAIEMRTKLSSKI